ncbi:Gfo/Idh/MocA family oxidoreductase [Pseudonocardia nematodicida]|uniref:Gfo/Idh/MocA family oxidoreductase n=1 Tax=Pseudonocardia nematodicida TaxID=1206997 RepID=A0ABV1KFH2_9PSEU
MSAGPVVAVVGGGFMARVHTRAARAAGATVAGVLASSPQRSREVAAGLGVARGYADLGELLGDPDVEVVHVCTPNALHAGQAAAAIAAGRHVVCEKPLAIAVPDAEDLVRAVAAAGLVGTVPFVYRFHPMVREARARFASGAAGPPVTISGSYLQDWMLAAGDGNWRVDAGAGGRSRTFADIGSHLVDLVEFVTGDRVTRLAATTRILHQDRAGHTSVTTEDAAALTLVTRGGAIGTLLVSQVAPGRKNRLAIEIAGTAESVGFDQEQPETLWVGRRAGSTLVPRDADQLAPDAARLCTVPAGHPQGYQDAFGAFVADTYAAVRGDEPEGLPRFADGLRTVRLTEAVLQSAADGGWIETGENQ